LFCGHLGYTHKVSGFASLDIETYCGNVAADLGDGLPPRRPLHPYCGGIYYEKSFKSFYLTDYVNELGMFIAVLEYMHAKGIDRGRLFLPIGPASKGGRSNRHARGLTGAACPFGAPRP
jgi:hypothetical protein